jgi:hypothetical protein
LLIYRSKSGVYAPYQRGARREPSVCTNKQADTVCGTALEKVHSKLDAMQNKNFENRRGSVKLMLPGGHLSKADRLLRDATYHQAEVKLVDKAFQKAVIEKNVDGNDAEVTDDHHDNSNDDGWSSATASEDEDNDANEEESNASDSP